MRRAKGACEYQDPQTGRICGSRHQVEIDHKLPRSLGGSNEESNLRCLCRKHNIYEGERLLGLNLMDRFREMS